VQARAHASPRSTHPRTPTQQAPRGTYLCTCTRDHACASTVCWRAGAGADGWDRRRTHLRCSTPHRPPAQTSQRARVEGRTTACRLAVRPSCLRGFPRRDRGFRASGGVLGRVRDGIAFRTPVALGSWASDAAVLRPARRGSLHPQKERYPPPPLPLLPTLVPPDGPHVPPPALGSSARARRTSQRAGRFRLRASVGRPFRTRLSGGTGRAPSASITSAERRRVTPSVRQSSCGVRRQSARRHHLVGGHSGAHGSLDGPRASAVVCVCAAALARRGEAVGSTSSTVGSAASADQSGRSSLQRDAYCASKRASTHTRLCAERRGCAAAGACAALRVCA
jgi:hypothetical protein